MGCPALCLTRCVRNAKLGRANMPLSKTDPWLKPLLFFCSAVAIVFLATACNHVEYKPSEVDTKSSSTGKVADFVSGGSRCSRLASF